MEFNKILYRILNWCLFFTIITASCVEKEIDPTDPAASFAKAREPYDDELYEVAIQRLGEFKSRFPYSKHAYDAELMIANSHFQLGHYAESASAYEQFIRLHPKHEQASFAQFRIGESYWSEAPEAIDREQDYTLKAIGEWTKLLAGYPSSEYSSKAKELLLEGNRRVAEHSEFIARFYCKQSIYHACAYRYLQLIESYPQFKDLTKKAYSQAALAFEQMAKSKNLNKDSDTNIYFKSMGSDELQKKARELREKSANL